MTAIDGFAYEEEGVKIERNMQNDPVGRFLKIKEVCVETGLSRATIYRCIQSENDPFPKPVKIGKASRWALCEIIEWKKKILMRRDCSEFEGA